MKEPEKTRKEAVAKPLPIGECWNEQHYEPEEIELQVALDVALDSGDFLFDGFRFPVFLEEKIGRYKKKTREPLFARMGGGWDSGIQWD